MRICVAGIVLALEVGACRADALVEPRWETTAFAGADVDSVAVWVAPDPSDSLLFVTEKALDRIEVRYAATGLPYGPMPFLGGERDSSAPGQFDRPNAVWVIYDVPFGDGFCDILLVTEQLNSRVQVFRLPGLETIGAFAEGDLSSARYFGRGLAAYHDGIDHYVFVTDRGRSEKVKKYRLIEAGGALGGELVAAFGGETGPGSLDIVESVLADPLHDRLHVCGDERGEWIRLFDLEGRYAGITYGEPQFEFDEEGIALYDTGGGEGYLVISDQYTNGEPNEFEIFDRVSLASLGHFESPEDGALVTRNTDGIFLCQRPLLGFPNGALFAVNDDANVHAYDWTDIAEAMGLEIVALDRPFPLPGGPRAGSARRALWYHDGSWWGAFASSGGLAIRRLEDGTFASRISLDPATPARIEAAASGDDLLLLAAGETARLHPLRYEPGRRRYAPAGDPVPLDLGGPAGAGLEWDGEGRAWIAWVEAGALRVSPSAPGDPTRRDGAPFELGAARDVPPAIARTEGGIAVLWAAEEGARARVHADGDPPSSWSAEERFAAGAVEHLAAAAAENELLAAVTGGEGGVWTRGMPRVWARIVDLGPEEIAPGLVVDRGTGDVYLIYDDASGPHRRLAARRAAAPAFDFDLPRILLARPGVEMGPPLLARDAPPGARDLVVAAAGSDGFGRFARIRLHPIGDITAPITMQHDPAPEATGVPEDARIAFRITDDIAGVDPGTLRVIVGGRTATPRVRGVPRNLLVECDLPPASGPLVAVRIEAADRADPPNVMHPFAYSFAVGGPGIPFRRGDGNDDGVLDIGDAIAILAYLFAEGPMGCPDAADVNDDGGVDLGDPISALNHLFADGRAPPAPFPGCGLDPTADDLPCAGTSCPP